MKSAQTYGHPKTRFMGDIGYPIHVSLALTSFLFDLLGNFNIGIPYVSN